MRVLIVEDDLDLARQLTVTLAGAGYALDIAYDGEEGYFLGDTESYDAVVLDLGLPKMDGVSLLKAWRAAGHTMPVLVLTARDGWSNKVSGLDAGADDYMVKPFRMEELLARIRALIRRSAGKSSPFMSCGRVMLDTLSGRVLVDDQEVKLTAHEYKLLAYLMHHSDKVISRTELTEHIYDQEFDKDSNTIEVFVNRIRKKLGVEVIKTVRGLGYRLEETGGV